MRLPDLQQIVRISPFGAYVKVSDAKELLDIAREQQKIIEQRGTDATVKTMQFSDQKRAFLEDLRKLINKHKATLTNNGAVDIDIEGEPTFQLPTYMSPESHTGPITAQKPPH